MTVSAPIVPNFFPGTIRSPQVVEFLTHLMRHIPGDILVIWDGLRSHRSCLVRDFVKESAGRIEIEFLPAYAPELNPVEYIWGHWKHHDLPNFCPKNLYQLSEHAKKHCGECADARRWLLLFGNRLNCFSVTLLCGTQ